MHSSSKSMDMRDHPVGYLFFPVVIIISNLNKHNAK